MARQTIYSFKRQRVFELIRELLRDPSLSFTEIWRRVNAQLCGPGERKIITLHELTDYCVYELGEPCSGHGRLRTAALRTRFQKLFFAGRDRYLQERRRRKLLRKNEPVRKISREERKAERERRKEERRQRKEALKLQWKLQKRREEEDRRRRILHENRWKNFAPEVAYWLSTIGYGWCSSCFYCFPLRHMKRPFMKVCVTCHFLVGKPLQ